jgi:pSer/pThr/pTyr-binding forkhead associated (FHA) protein
MLDLLDTSYPFNSSTFYNATFLYGLDFASIGLTQIAKDVKGYQEIIAEPLPRTYRKVILRDGVPVGMLSLGNRKDALAFKRAIDHRVNLLPVASQLFTEGFKLNDWLDREGVPSPLPGVSRKGDAAVRQVAYVGGTTVGATIIKPQPPTEALLVPIADKTQAQQRGKPQQHSEKETHLSQTKIMTVGRQEGVYLLIDNDSVSRRHAEISYANNNYVLRDLGSSNGTFVNEEPLEAGKVYILKPNDRVRFGKVQFIFQVRSSVPVEVSMKSLRHGTLPGIPKLHDLTTGFYDPVAAGQNLPPSGQPILNADGSLMLPGATSALPADIIATFKKEPALIILVHGSPQVAYMKPGRRVTLGRDKACNVVLTDVAASRRHAERDFKESSGYRTSR